MTSVSPAPQPDQPAPPDAAAPPAAEKWRAAGTRFSRHSLLSEEEAAAVRARIETLRDHWIPRSDKDPSLIYTLGRTMAFDHDVDEGGHEVFGKRYTDAAREANPVLRTAFGDLYSLVQDKLEEIVGEPVWLHDDVAHPGFMMIFGEALKAPVSPPHFDMQYRSLSWPAPCDDWNAISFTLPISLPPGGGWLRVWDVDGETYLDATRATGISLDDYIRDRTSTLESYSVGEMFVHHGVYLHRISPIEEAGPSDERITLQGFAARVRGNWFMHY